MDADQTYRELQAALVEYQLARERGDYEQALEAADKASELYAALDQWIRTGGFLPRKWARQRSW